MKLKNFFKYAKDEIDSAIYKKKYKKPNVLSDIETIDYILKNKCSISRFGDGELRLMRGIDLEFQDYDKTLSEKLKTVKTTDKCLACIPDIFDDRNFNKINITDEEFDYWNSFKKHREGLWYKYFGEEKCLGDAFISRFYLRKKDKSNIKEYIVKLKQLWQGRDIVFVEGEKSRLGVGNDLFDNANSIKRILCPATNSYLKYNEIKNYILQSVSKNNLIIMAIGPTATALSYELSSVFQCLDLGHIDIEYEWFRMGVTKKVKIPSKYVNEAEGGRNPDDSTDEKYKQEIIKSF